MTSLNSQNLEVFDNVNVLGTINCAGQLSTESIIHNWTDYPGTITTAGAVTYTTTQVHSGIINRDCNGGGRADLLPTTAQLLALFPSPVVGASFDLWIRNVGGANDITLTRGDASTTVRGTATITATNGKLFKVRISSVVGPTIDVISMGFTSTV